MTDNQPAGNTGIGVPPEASLMREPGTQQSESCDEAGLPDAVLALTVSYEGSHFSGFARQEFQRTVQGELEQALHTIYHREVVTTGAGRTDAGVHALGNVVSFGLAQGELEERGFDRLQSSLNALTPESLVVKRIQQMPAEFSARFSAQAREYRYRIYPSATPPVFLAPYVWWLKVSEPLDIAALKLAASYFEGEHDFRSFCVAKSAASGPTTRTVSKVMVFGSQHLGEQCMVVQVIGNAFLHSMVRVMVGSLVEVCLRRQPPEWIRKVLEARDRRAAGQTAPAQGLTLWRVIY
ncbi:MAG: tRNA pseudouridine(38-40) synthase TruA [Coriobacteriales bacterium]|jgi:tRNA pseudouridine38-40 synthase|nr:tRNA pseudouridine(38-40) synthase TruA [Coriobacteriales bacterium]